MPRPSVTRMLGEGGTVTQPACFEAVEERADGRLRTWFASPRKVEVQDYMRRTPLPAGHQWRLYRLTVKVHRARLT